MKILLVSEFYTPHWTGIVKGFAAIAKYLRSHDNEITVLTTKYQDDLPAKEKVDGVTVIRTPYLFKLSRMYYSLSLLSILWRIIKDFETVVINSPNSNILFITLIAKLKGKKVIVFHQGDLVLPRKTGNQIVNRLLEVLFTIITIPAMALADKVSTYTEDYAKHSRVMKLFMYKFFAFIPPITLSEKKPSAAFSKKMADLKKNYVLIGFAGRFVEEKGFDILFQAIPHVIKTIPNAHFVFAGQTEMSYEPFFEKNKKLIEQNKKFVTFLGLLDEANLTQFYKSLSIFVMSSRSDCFGLTQLEAALSGVPVVVADIPGARILVKETGCGALVKPEDPEDLKGEIISILNNASFWRSEAKSRIFSSITRFLKKYEDFKLH
jgi:glycosyltransferase involved in cell wall biosynthesis